MNDVCTVTGMKGTWDYYVEHANKEQPRWYYEVRKDGEEPVRFATEEKETANDLALEIGGELWLIDARQD